MNRLAHWVLRLYPAHWRKRYGDEVDALLTDAGADARTVADLAKGGVRMQFSTWSFPKLTAAFGVAGLLSGAAFSLFLPSEYTSKATLQLTPTQIDSTKVRSAISNPLNEHILEIETEVLSRARLASLIRELGLYPDEKTLDDSVESMRQDIHITFVAAPGSLKGASAFDVEFTYPDRYKAQRTVTAVVNSFTAINQAAAVQDAAATDRPVSSITVLDTASLPQTPFSPSRIVALLSMHLIPDQYRSVAALRLDHGTNDQVMAITARTLSRTSLTSIINDPRLLLYRDELRTTRLEDVIQLMKQNVRILLQGDHGGPVFAIVFDYPDRYKARMTVEALMDHFSQASREMFPVSARVMAGPPMILDVLDTASLPSTPSKPHRPVIAIAGGLWGIVLGAIISVIRRLRMPPAIVTLNAANG